MHTTQRHNISLVSAIGLPTVIAFAALFCSTVYLIGDYVYLAYFQKKPVELVASTDRAELEAKHRELLLKSGFRDDVKLGSVSDDGLKTANRKLETALRSGK